MLTTTNCKSVTAQVAGGPQNKFGKVYGRGVWCPKPKERSRSTWSMRESEYSNRHIGKN